MARQLSNIGPAWLDDATTDDIVRLPIDQLVALDDELGAMAAKVRLRRDRLAAGLRARFVPGEPIPGTNWKKDGSWGVRIEVTKQVVWDQAKIEAAARTAKENGFNAWEVMKVELSLPEAVYKAMQPAIKELFTPARAVKTGKPAITFHKGRAAA